MTKEQLIAEKAEANSREALQEERDEAETIGYCEKCGCRLMEWVVFPATRYNHEERDNNIDLDNKNICRECGLDG